MPSTKMDGDDFLSAFRRGMGGVTATEWPSSDCLMFINLAQNQLASLRGWDIPALESSEDITTVAGQEEYLLSATDVLKIRYLSSTNYPRLKKVDHDYRLRVGSLSSPDPWAWFESGGSNDGSFNISLVGTPSEAGKTITVWYTKVPTAIVTSPVANVSILPQAYDLAIVQTAVAIAKSLSVQALEAGRQRVFADIATAIAANTTPGNIEHIWRLAGFGAANK